MAGPSALSTIRRARRRACRARPICYCRLGGHGVTRPAAASGSVVRLKGDANLVLALRRGLSILDTFSGHTGDLGVNEIARHAGMHKSTVSRLCATLENAGYLERDPAPNRFRLGARIHQLAGPSSPTADLRDVARPVMLELVETSRETATLGVRD